jgi:hypothetical protein
MRLAAALLGAGKSHGEHTWGGKQGAVEPLLPAQSMGACASASGSSFFQCSSSVYCYGGAWLAKVPDFLSRHWTLSQSNIPGACDKMMSERNLQSRDFLDFMVTKLPTLEMLGGGSNIKDAQNKRTDVSRDVDAAITQFVRREAEAFIAAAGPPPPSDNARAWTERQRSTLAVIPWYGGENGTIPAPSAYSTSHLGATRESYLKLTVTSVAHVFPHVVLVVGTRRDLERANRLRADGLPVSRVLLASSDLGGGLQRLPVAALLDVQAALSPPPPTQMTEGQRRVMRDEMADGIAWPPWSLDSSAGGEPQLLFNGQPWLQQAGSPEVGAEGGGAPAGRQLWGGIDGAPNSTAPHLGELGVPFAALAGKWHGRFRYVYYSEPDQMLRVRNLGQLFGALESGGDGGGGGGAGGGGGGGAGEAGGETAGAGLEEGWTLTPHRASQLPSWGTFAAADGNSSSSLRDRVEGSGRRVTGSVTGRVIGRISNQSLRTIHTARKATGGASVITGGPITGGPITGGPITGGPITGGGVGGIDELRGSCCYVEAASGLAEGAIDEQHPVQPS